MDLEVLVDDASDGTRKSFRFGRSPIRLGRSPLNDLPLPWGFVSHCHAVIQFDDACIQLVDLGSTNGTLVRGARLAHNTPVAVDADTVVQIGALALRLAGFQHVERNGIGIVDGERRKARHQRRYGAPGTQGAEQLLRMVIGQGSG